MLTLTSAALLVTALAAHPAEPQPARRAMTVDDAMSMVRVSNVLLSPDGRSVFYTERTLDWEKNRYVSAHFLAPADGRPAREIIGEGGGSGFQFTPDGSGLSFLRDVDGTPQVYLLPLDQGGEARPTTDHPEGVDAYQWARRGGKLFFVSEDPRDATEQAERDAGGDVVFVGEGPNGQEAGKYSNLWMFDPERGESKRLTGGAWQIESFDVDPRGGRIVFQALWDMRQNYFFRADLHLLDVESGTVTRLTDNESQEEDPRWSPDGKSIAYHSPDAAWSDLRNGYLWILDVESGARRKLLGQQRGELGTFTWSRDGQSILFTESRGVNTSLYRLDVARDEVEALFEVEGRLRVHGFSDNKRQMAYSFEDFTTPPDVFVADIRGQRPVRITDSNPWILAELALGHAETIQWKSKDGTAVEGILMLPPSEVLPAQPAQPYPLIMNIHGGPPGFYGNDFDPEFHIWSGLGYAAFGPNPRGSSSYGDDFLRALMGDVGGGEFDDLMTGVDQLIERGVADPKQLALRGWSWGGILGAWTITHTDRFAAAALGAMVGDWFVETGGGVMYDLRLHYIRSEPYENPAEWRARSPLTYVRNVTTPTLLLHGEKDDVSTVNQSMAFYTALRDRGVPVRFLKFPRQGHDIKEPRLRRICDTEEIRWIQQHTRGIDWEPGPFESRPPPKTQAWQTTRRSSRGDAYDDSWIARRPSLSSGSIDDLARTELDQFLIDVLKEGDAPALSAAVVANSEILWQGAYGWANVEKRIPATTDTVFLVASVSKTITSYVVMQLVESGQLDLDADINLTLPFKVVHPKHGARITLRKLLTHTAAIRDNWSIMEGTWVKNGDYPMTLEASLKSYLTPGGGFYDPDESFYEWAPGTKYRYSNVGVALAALMAEHASAQSFESLAKEHVFEPLRMEQSAFRLGAFNDFSQIAMPYERDDSGKLEPLGHHGYLDYPAGTLRTSPSQLARFLLSFIGEGTLDGARLLRPETVAEMRRVQFPQIAPKQGLVWYYEGEAHALLGHDGGDPGVATQMYFRPADGVGVILFLNGDLARGGENAVVNRLFEVAAPAESPPR